MEDGLAKCAQDCSQSSISHKKKRKKLSCLERFWKMRPGKGARDCSESLISQRNKTVTFGGLFEDEVGKLH